MGWNRVKKLFKKRKTPEQIEKIMLQRQKEKEGVGIYVATIKSATKRER